MKQKIVLLIIILTSICMNISAQQLSLQWAQRFGQSGWDYANCLITSPSGNYLFGGSVNGSLTGDSTHPELAFSNNAFIASCDTNGNIQWQKMFGGRMFENVTSLAKTPQGILISGIFQDTIQFNGLQATTEAFTGAYLCLIDEQGNPIWIKNIGGYAIVKNIFLSSTLQGVAYIAGTFTDSLQLAGEEKAIKGEKGFFFSALTADGNEINPLVFKGSGTCSLGGICCNDSIICMAGSFSDTLQINDKTLVSIGQEDIFVAFFNTNGILKHLITGGGIGIEQILDVIFSPIGDIAITGSFDNSILIGNEILQSNGGKDIFVSVIDTAGNLKWIKNIGGLGDDRGYSLAVNSDCNYFISGNYVHYVTMPDANGNIVELDASNAFGNAFIAKYNSKGDLVASYNLPATSEDYCKGLLADDNGMITAAGNFYQNMQLQKNSNQTIEIISKGERDIFLIKFFDLCDNISINAGIDTVICSGQSIELITTGTFNYFRWLPGGIPDHNLEITQPGTYKLLITDSNGCIASDSLQVLLKEYPIVFAGADTTIEAGIIIELDQAVVGYTDSFLWNTEGSGYFGNAGLLTTYFFPSFSDISSGSVQISLSATNQCATVVDTMLVSIQQDEDGITVFPNPSDGSVNLVCVEGKTIQTASITMQSGTVIESNIPVNCSVMQYNLSAYPPGTFLFHLSTNTNNITKIIHKL